MKLLLVAVTNIWLVNSYCQNAIMPHNWPVNQIDTIGQKTGLWIEEVNKNQFHYSNYVDGLLSGEQLIFINGYLRTKIQYNNGLKHGILIEYYYDGKPFIIEHYVKDSLDGQRCFFEENNILKSIIMYENGIRQGCTFYFDSQDGTLNVIEYYRDNKREGESIGFYPNGSIYFKMNYKNDDLDGERIIYSETGEIIVHDYYEKGIFVKKL